MTFNLIIIFMIVSIIGLVNGSIKRNKKFLAM